MCILEKASSVLRPLSIKAPKIIPQAFYKQYNKCNTTICYLLYKNDGLLLAGVAQKIVLVEHDKLQYKCCLTN